MIKAIIFDLDGVLVDATSIHKDALNDALGVFGYTIGNEEHISKYNGLPTAKKLEMLSTERGLPRPLHHPIKELKKIFTNSLVEQFCAPDYSKLIMLKSLKNKGYKLACCSNAIKDSVVMMLKKTGLIDFFDLVVGNDEGLAPKPSPDIYLYAFKQLNLSPNECVIVEDADHGVRAAIASGASVIRVSGYREVNSSLLIKHNLL